jgi:hypothetical protein
MFSKLQTPHILLFDKVHDHFENDSVFANSPTAWYRKLHTPSLYQPNGYPSPNFCIVVSFVTLRDMQRTKIFKKKKKKLTCSLSVCSHPRFFITSKTVFANDVRNRTTCVCCGFGLLCSFSANAAGGILLLTRGFRF